MGKKMSTWRLFKWGAANHPGNVVYMSLWLLLGYVALGGAWPTALVGAGALAILYVCTSILVGKANKSLIEKDDGQ